jgi:hypothetical protein
MLVAITDTQRPVAFFVGQGYSTMRLMRALNWPRARAGVCIALSRGYSGG